MVPTWHCICGQKITIHQGEQAKTEGSRQSKRQDEVGK
jgi:hypothetical protein